MDFRDIIRHKPYHIWYTKNYDGLGEESVVEAVLNYGDWDDLKQLCTILGIKRVAEIFWIHIQGTRCNYKPEVVNFFQIYFRQYVEGKDIEMKCQRCHGNGTISFRITEENTNLAQARHGIK